MYFYWISVLFHYRFWSCFALNWTLKSTLQFAKSFFEICFNFFNFYLILKDFYAQPSPLSWYSLRVAVRAIALGLVVLFLRKLPLVDLWNWPLVDLWNRPLVGLWNRPLVGLWNWPLFGRWNCLAQQLHMDIGFTCKIWIRLQNFKLFQFLFFSAELRPEASLQLNFKWSFYFFN